MYFGRPETGLININLPFLLEIRLHIPQSQDVYMGGAEAVSASGLFQLSQL